MINATSKEVEAQYDKLVREMTPNSPHVKNIIMAFLFGGLICMIGQAIFDISGMLFPDLSMSELGSVQSITLIFITALLTGLGIFDKIGNIAGAGTMIPITGFANAVSSTAIEFKKEGIIFGLSSKMYFVAGPVIVNGITSSVIVGIIYYLIYLIF